MTNDIAIRVRGLGKSYTIVHDERKATNLGEAISNRLRNPLHRPQKETFWALRDVDLDIKKGEVVGIIGRNGAGKSTLLKVLSRITEPTTGQVDLYGRVGSLLEVGTGFHPELTGRENIFLNGAILGMKRGEIRKQYDAIVDFAGVEKFLDTPVKRYSSGMYVRLAFAVAAHLNPEILLVDEVLAVGDAEFQKKCLGKMKDVARGGRTVIFVSHNMAAVRNLCDRAILVKEGKISVDGPVERVVYQYSGCDTDSGELTCDFPIMNHKTGVELVALRASCDASPTGLDVNIHMDINLHKEVDRLGIGLHVTTEEGWPIAKLAPRFTGAVLDQPPSEFSCVLRLPGIHRHLSAGIYHIGITLHQFGVRTLLEAESVVTVELPPVDVYGTYKAPQLHINGIVPLPVELQFDVEHSRSKMIVDSAT